MGSFQTLDGLFLLPLEIQKFQKMQQHHLRMTFSFEIDNMPVVSHFVVLNVRFSARQILLTVDAFRSGDIDISK